MDQSPLCRIQGATPNPRITSIKAASLEPKWWSMPSAGLFPVKREQEAEFSYIRGVGLTGAPGQEPKVAPLGRVVSVIAIYHHLANQG
jgi:hypothetical protein